MAISSFDSTVISTESAAQLARCDELGAGNVLEHALRCSPAPRSPSIWLEREWRGLTARPVDRFSLDSLSTVVDRYASAYHRAGVGPRDVVALLLAEGIAPFVHYLALTRLGAIPAPINGGLARDDVVGYLRRLAPRALVADRTLHGAARRGIAGTDVLDVEARAPGGVLPEPYPYRHSAGDPVLIAHTSGTTGAPKPVTMLHGSFLHAVRTRLAASVRPGERVLSAVPHTHAAGIASFLTSTLRGAAKLVLSDLSAANLVRAVESFRPTTVVAFTGAYAELASLDLARHDLGSVDQWIATADAAHRRHVVALLAATARSRRGRPRPVFVDGFGSSELANTVFRRVSTLDDPAEGRHLGRPAEYARAAVLDAHGRELPAGRVGRLGVMSPTVTAGYWNDSDLTYRARLAGYWLTGDLAWRDSNGDYYHADRVADAFESAGRLVCTVLLEELVLGAVPEVHDAAVFGVPLPDGDVAPAIVVKPAPGRRVPPADLLSRVNETLRQRGEPSCRALLVATRPAHWPLGPTGKVLKRRLREEHREALRDPERRRELVRTGRCAFLDDRAAHFDERDGKPPGR